MQTVLTCHLSVDPRDVSPGTADAPADDPDESVAGVVLLHYERSSTVPLAGILQAKDTVSISSRLSHSRSEIQMKDYDVADTSSLMP